MKKFLASVLIFLFIISIIFLQAQVYAGAGIDVTGTTGWTAVLPANNQFDYIGDQQTGSGSVSQDIVGDENYRAFFVKYDDVAGEIAFRFRVNNADNPGNNKFNNFAFVGVDANIDGAIDFFVGVYAPTGNGRIGIYNANPAKLNISPSTTGITNPPITEYAPNANVNYSIMTASDSNFSGDPDFFITFKLPVADINAAMATVGKNITINSSTPLKYIIGTAAEDNSFNQDIGGIQGISTNDTTTWVALGVFSPSITTSGEQINYTVTFNKNGGDTDANPTTRPANHGGNVGALPTAPTRTGYTFSGWNTQADGNGTAFDAATAVTSNITVYVRWTHINTPPTVTDYIINTMENTEVSGQVIGTDKDNDTLAYTIDRKPSHGIITVSINGKWTCTPAQDFYGEDTFSIKVDDGNGGTAVSDIKIIIDAEKIILNGTIRERDTKNPIANTLVQLYDLSGNQVASKTTDANGKYEFTNIIDGQYKIIVTNPTYADNQRSVIVSTSNAKNNIITEDFEMVGYSIRLAANPSSVVGDGIEETVLTTIIKDKNGDPVEGVLVMFDAPIGNFYNGRTAITDANGQAQVPYRSIKIIGIDEQIIPVTATVANSIRGLYAMNRIYITFEPGAIAGIIIDNNTGKAVKGAIVVVSKDFNGDGIVDFYATQTTSDDGKYSIAIPKGNIEYDIEITKSVTIEGTTSDITFIQKANTGEIKGTGDENFTSDETAAGVIVSKEPDGTQGKILDYANLKLEVYDSTGNSINSPNATIDNSGKFNVTNLESGKNYEFKVKYELSPGVEIVVGSVNVNLKQDGEMNISQILIDPYGVVTDTLTGANIEGVKVTLYYADTERNRKNGIIPDTLVPLPIIEGFSPNDNINPQVSDVGGKYAFMVFPFTDYTINATKDGYEPYKSPVINVETEIVKHVIKLKPIIKPEDISIFITADKKQVQENNSVICKLNFENKSLETVMNNSINVTLPKGITVTDSDGGIINGDQITWNLGDLKAGQKGQITLKIKIGKVGNFKKDLIITTKISSKDTLINLADDEDKVKIEFTPTLKPVLDTETKSTDKKAKLKDSDKLPKTGDSSSNNNIFSGLFLILISICIVRNLRRRHG